jgi:hypothetical protein
MEALEYRVGGGLRLLAVLCLVVPLVAAPLLLGERRASFTCARTAPREGICTIAHARLLWTDREEVPLGFILRARLEPAEGLVRLALVTPQGQTPVLETTLENGERMRRAIDHFVADPGEPSLEVSDGRGYWMYVFYASLVLSLAAFAVYLLRAAPRVTIELDPALDVLRVVRKVWLLRPAPRSFARARLADAVVEGIPEASPDRWRVVLVTREGERAPLTRAYHAGDRAPHDALVEKIRAFVG